jgi:hypothetical protein
MSVRNLAAEQVLMVRRSVGVSVDEPPDPVTRHVSNDGIRCHIHDFALFLGIRQRALAPVIRRKAAPLAQGLTQKQPLHQGVADLSAEAKVGFVVRAEQISVHEQHRFAGESDDSGVAQQPDPGAASEAPTEQEVPIAVHQKAGRARSYQVRQRRLHGSLAIVVVADPDVEQITEDVERIGTTRPPPKKREEQLRQLGPVRG